MLQDTHNAATVDVIIPTTNAARAESLWAAAYPICGVPDARLIVAEDPGHSGFTRAANSGLRQTTGAYVCLLNDDARPLTPDWLAKLVAVMETDKTIGFVGPSGGCRTQPQCQGKRNDDAIVISQVDHLAFFCVVIRAILCQAVGLLDERYIHYGSDVDYQWRAREFGYKAVWAQHVYVKHPVRPFLEPWRSQDAKVMMQRWGHA